MTKQGNLIPYIIIAAFIAFGAYIIRFVVKSHDTSVNLVSEDYYAREVAFQDQIEINKASKPFASDYSLTVSDDQLAISFAEELQGLKGELLFYRPANHKMDFRMKLNLATKNTMTIKTDQIKSGYWMVQATGEKDGQQYFFEKELNLE